MKKISFLLCALILACGNAFAQANIFIEAPQNNNSTSGVRAPNGTSGHAFMRGCFLVLSSELANLPVSTTLTSFGYTLASGVAGSAVNGSITVYLENTIDNTYQKSATFATAITGMTSVYANVMTIPVSASTTSIMVTLSTPFVYNGGGMYVAYDWNSVGPFSTTSAVYLCEATALNPGGATAASAASAPTTLGGTAFRPAFLFGYTNPNTNDMQVLGIQAPGKVPVVFNPPHTISALVKNGSSGPLSNVSVSLNVTGANPFTDVQNVSLAAGASMMVNFTPFNPQNPGLNNIVVSVPSDQVTVNDSEVFSQSVTCSEWAQNPATGSYTSVSLGFAAGSGIIGVYYSNPASSTLTAVRIAVSTATTGIGQTIYGALLSATGTTLAITSPVTLTSGMLGTYVQLPFSSPQVLNAFTNYYIGGAQTVGSVAYHPFGTQASQFLPPNLYAYTSLSGGAMTQLGVNYGYLGLEAVFDHTVTLSVTPQTVTCGSGATMQAVSSTNYSWSTGAITSSISVSPTVNSVYTVVATNTLGCIRTETVELTIAPLPVSGMASSNVICAGESVTLTATGADTYTWSAGANPHAATLIETPVSTTIYSLSGSNTAGCENSAMVMVSVQSFSTLGIPAPTESVCTGNSLVLSAFGASTYTWSTPAGTFSTAVISATPQTSSVYTVTGADNLGCTMSHTIAVNVVVVPLLTMPDTAVCNGSDIVLWASGASSYSWHTGWQFSTFPVNNVTSPGSYTVTAFDNQQCSAAAVINLSVNPNPTMTVKAARTSMCLHEKNKIEITAQGATTYSWNTGATTPSIVLTATSTIQKNYTAWAFNEYGCSDEDKVTVLIKTCVGIGEEPAQQVLKIYPNPGNGLYQITGADTEGAMVSVYNTLGALISVIRLNGEQTELNISEAPAGVYLITFEKDGQVHKTGRIIKQ